MSELNLKDRNLDLVPLQSLLRTTATEFGVAISDDGIEQMATHFALLLKWNRKMNLTSLTQPEEIAARHFGESLYLSRFLRELDNLEDGLLVDVGSGAGFPGLPLKIVLPELVALLIEPNQKKATFLKEVVRTARIKRVEVRASRLDEAISDSGNAGACISRRASIVTMRAVGLSTALFADLRRLLKPSGTLALFLGNDDVPSIIKIAGFEWMSPLAVPNSERRVIMMGKLHETQ